MNLIYDTQNELLTSKFAHFGARYQRAMNSPIDRLDGLDKIHWIVKDIYRRRGNSGDFLLYAVHIVIIDGRGEFTEQIEEFLQMFNLRRWQGVGKQPNERVAYQGWVNGYGIKAISSEALVAGIFNLEGAQEITILERR